MAITVLDAYSQHLGFPAFLWLVFGFPIGMFLLLFYKWWVGVFPWLLVEFWAVITVFSAIVMLIGMYWGWKDT